MTIKRSKKQQLGTIIVKKERMNKRTRNNHKESRISIKDMKKIPKRAANEVKTKKTDVKMTTKKISNVM